MYAISANVADSDRLNLDFRRASEQLVERASRLRGRDRLWVVMYLNNGNTFAQIAQLSGVSQSTVSRRDRKVISHLARARYLELLKNSGKLSFMEMQMAEDYFVRGCSMRSISRNRQLSYYQVRMNLMRIRKLLARLREKDTSVRQSGGQNVGI